MYKIKDVFKYVARKELKVGNLSVVIVDGISEPKLCAWYTFAQGRKRLRRIRYRYIEVGKDWVIDKINKDYPHLVGHIFK